MGRCPSCAATSIVVVCLRRFEGLDLTPEELQQQASDADNVDSLSEDEIESIVRKVVAENDTDSFTPELSWFLELDTDSVEDGIMQLNRNRGELDEQIEEKLKEWRKQELEKDDNGDDDVETD